MRTSGYSTPHCRSGTNQNLVERSGAERSGEWALQKNDGAERGAGSHGAGRERRAGVTEIS